jgi:hypothetical protein
VSGTEFWLNIHSSLSSDTVYWPRAVLVFTQLALSSTNSFLCFHRANCTNNLYKERKPSRYVLMIPLSIKIIHKTSGLCFWAINLVLKLHYFRIRRNFLPNQNTESEYVSDLFPKSKILISYNNKYYRAAVCRWLPKFRLAASILCYVACTHRVLCFWKLWMMCFL